MAPLKEILVVCGEASGDLNASNLISALIDLEPNLKISGVGGPLMAKAGAEVFYDIKGLSVIGLFDVLKKLPKFFALKKIILKKIKQKKPDAVVLVDFSGFNLRLAKAINNSYPVIYYVSPQVWASRLGRIMTINKYISKMIVLFKFEEEFYKNYGISVDFAGHPLLDIVKPTMDLKEFLGRNSLTDSKTTIVLLPGSRKSEVKNILPLMIKTAILIEKNIPQTQFIIAKSLQVDWDIYNKLGHGLKLDIRIIEGKTYDCLQAADLSLVASGTATLEAAIMQKPFFVVYKMNLLNYLLYRPQVKIPYIGMVNIVAQKKIVPEFVQFGARPVRISKEAVKILKNSAEAEKMILELKQIRPLLGENGAAKRAAKIILEFLKK